MTEAQQIIIYDAQVIDHQLIDYFKQFNIEIIQQKSLPKRLDNNDQPIAVLIHWNLLKDNLSIIEDLLQNHAIPLITIQDEPLEDLTVQALEAGADDVLSKPINPRELHARISAVNRRVLRSEKKRKHDKEVIQFADWLLYPTSRQIFNKHDHQELILSAGEYELLYAFLREPQQTLNREYLIQMTKQSGHHHSDRRIDVQISRLRQKLEPQGKSGIIKTIRNSGYLFTAEVRHLKNDEH